MKLTFAGGGLPPVFVLYVSVPLSPIHSPMLHIDPRAPEGIEYKIIIERGCYWEGIGELYLASFGCANKKRK